MDFIKCNISEDDYKTISKEVRTRIEILNVEPKDFDYSGDGIWKELKSASTKAYKKVKEREYKIRQNLL